MGGTRRKPGHKARFGLTALGIVACVPGISFGREAASSHRRISKKCGKSRSDPAFPKVAQLIRVDGNDVLLQEETVRITQPAGVDSPEGLVFITHVALLSRQFLAEEFGLLDCVKLRPCHRRRSSLR